MADEKDDARRLWGPEHAYYCNEGNYYAKGSDTIQNYSSWSDFVAAEGDADLDLNLVFRWDWGGIDEGDKAAIARVERDPYYRGETLQLSIMGQRKGLYRCVLVSVCRADEPEVRAWLKTRWEHLHALWAPISAASDAARRDDVRR